MNLRRFVTDHVIVTQQRPTVEQLLRSFAKSETVSCASAVCVISANKRSLQELTQVIRIKLLILRFPEIFVSYSQFPGGKCTFAPCGRPFISYYYSCYVATMVLPLPHDILHSSPMYNQVFLVFCKRKLGS